MHDFVKNNLVLCKRDIKLNVWISMLKIIFNIPLQLNPSPLYPGLQVHVNEPPVFEHCAFPSHGLVAHSLMSKNLI